MTTHEASAFLRDEEAAMRFCATHGYAYKDTDEYLEAVKIVVDALEKARKHNALLTRRNILSEALYDMVALAYDELWDEEAESCTVS